MGMDRGEEQLQEPAADEQEKIFVTVRLRPLNEKEASRHDVSDWECINDTTIIYKNNLSASERSMYPPAYTFDRVFSPECSTRKVYDEGAKRIALSVVSGINSSVFAYGQTSSGKTYTMSGITEYTVADIYDYIETHKERKFVLKFSAMEIYNESVRDFLSTDSTPLRLLDDPERCTVVEKLTEATLRDRNHFKELLSVCEAQRRVGETSLNDTSSRSHQILRLTVESSAHEFSGNDKLSILTATVNFVDLAGSERASQTLSMGTRLKEGCHINRSLLTLGTVIRKLSKGRSGHIPFRDSKLTRILQPTLGGNARAAIICTLSPARTHVEQSRNTLLFASCAKEVTTNAQVNVVMSDKALVKQLQRELTRLENELRNAGRPYVPADTACLLREKDHEIEQLKEQIKELIWQRDIARSEVEDLRQVVGEERLGEEKPPKVWVNLENHYPKLRVQNSWDESSATETAVLVAPHCQFSDRLSYSSEDSFLQLPDFKLKILRSNSSTKLSPEMPEFTGSNLHQEEHDEQVEENLEDICKVVRCIDSERSSENRNPDLNMSNFSPESYRQDNGMLPPRMNTATSGPVDAEKDSESHWPSQSFSLKEQALNKIHPDFLVPSPENLSLQLLDKDISSCRGLNLTRSRSCKASLRIDSESVWFDREEYIEKTPPTGYEKDFVGRPRTYQRKFAAFKFERDGKMLSRNGSQNSSKTAATDEVNAMNVTNPSQETVSIPWTLARELKEISNLQYVKQFTEQGVQATEEETTAHDKAVKDVGLDPIPNDMDSPSRWPSEFKRLQREIIELWHSCNISLVHRTYFFLLFKGDPQDHIYMEVEIRRLSFLTQNQTLENGQHLNPASSLKALGRERHMLSQQMKKKFSEEQRENIFLKWGIGLETKYRRLQLAHRLWSDTSDMNHVSESATIVARLVDSVEPEKTFKEMFGLSFAPRQRTNKTFKSFRSSVMSIL